MDEQDYWLSLEYRICDELQGLLKHDLRYLWCDGVEPQQYLLDDPMPRITGRIWLCWGPDQRDFEFTLSLPHSLRSRDELEWAQLLPPADATGWLSVDAAQGRVEIRPAEATSASALPQTEDDYWPLIEYRVRCELERMAAGGFPSMRLEGLTPDLYRVDDPTTPRITGRAGLDDRVLADWSFVLVLPTAARSREEIEWPSLLPPLGSTLWLSVDATRRILELTPAAALDERWVRR